SDQIVGVSSVFTTQADLCDGFIGTAGGGASGVNNTVYKVISCADGTHRTIAALSHAWSVTTKPWTSRHARSVSTPFRPSATIAAPCFSTGRGAMTRRSPRRELLSNSTRAT